MKSNGWKYVALGVVFIVVLLVLLLPLKTVSTEISETYYVTEMRQETSTVNEPYVIEEMREKSETIFDGYSLAVPNGIDIPFYIDKPDAQLIGRFEVPTTGGFYIYSSGRIIYEELGSQGAFEIALSEGKYMARLRESTMWGEECYVKLVIKWTELEKETKYRETIEYREVPVQVEKQRAVTKHEKVSIWEWLFR